MQSIDSKIISRIYGRGRGCVVTPKDFLNGNCRSSKWLAYSGTSLKDNSTNQLLLRKKLSNEDKELASRHTTCSKLDC